MSVAPHANGETCAGCSWWDGDPPDANGGGFCRRLPPIPDPMTGGALWPRTTPDTEACGEWDKAKPKRKGKAGK